MVESSDLQRRLNNGLLFPCCLPLRLRFRFLGFLVGLLFFTSKKEDKLPDYCCAYLLGPGRDFQAR